MSTPASNLARFFRRSADGKPRTLILPVDHGTAIPVPGLRDLPGLLAAAWGVAVLVVLWVTGFWVTRAAAPTSPP